MVEIPPPNSDRLDSWKDIANFFGVTVRTVQFWEKERGLPVHRLPGPKGRVYAYKSEVSAWAEGKTGEAAREQPESASGSRRMLFLATAIAVCSAVVWGVAALYPRSKLIDCRVEGQELVALGTGGSQLWRYPLAHTMTAEALKSVAGRAKPWIGDLDGDGAAELLFADLQAPDFQSDRLLCLSSSGDLRWSVTPGQTVSSGYETFKPPFRIADFRVARLGPDKGLAVVLTAHHQINYPFQVASISPAGTLLRQYWHSGHLGKMEVGDLNHDGRDEIYLAGCSNSYKAPALVVLDPLTMAGASKEEKDAYQLQGFPPAQEAVRILFPVSHPARGLVEYGTASNMALSPTGITVFVEEVPWVHGPITIFAFTPEMKLRDVSVADNYELSLRLAGRPNQRFSSEDKRELERITYLTPPNLAPIAERRAAN